ncbi:MAG: hypothetical protein IJH43_06150 [Mogibacterium sp.]|nr:hypothetical protein [Mogibacterium sp.]
MIRSREWRETLDDLMQKTGTSISQIADYIDVPYNGSETNFYAKLPQKRRKFIGIGMALGQPATVINNWILKYSGKRRLYVKDVSEDLVWLYLIELNHRYMEENNFHPAINYYKMYEDCQNTAYITYRQLWEEVILNSIDTQDLEVRLEDAVYDETFEGLKEFIFDNMDSFKTAYTKPRKMLDSYVECILEGLTAGLANDNASDESRHIKGSKYRLNGLRGFLDDSMINYLSGDIDTHHVIDRKKGVRILSTKHIPASRKIHISMCLALGMTGDEVDQYLRLMGFAPLGSKDPVERFLAEALDSWEKEHPLQRAMKSRCIYDEPIDLDSTEMLKAAESMLQLRLDLRDRFAKQGLMFPYYTEKRKPE